MAEGGLVPWQATGLRIEARFGLTSTVQGEHLFSIVYSFGSTYGGQICVVWCVVLKKEYWRAMNLLIPEMGGANKCKLTLDHQRSTRFEQFCQTHILDSTHCKLVC